MRRDRDVIERHESTRAIADEITRAVPLHIAEHAAAAFGWPLQIVEGAAHAPHFEQPEAFIRTLSTIDNGRD